MSQYSHMSTSICIIPMRAICRSTKAAPPILHRPSKKHRETEQFYCSQSKTYQHLDCTKISQRYCLHFSYPFPVLTPRACTLQDLEPASYTHDDGHSVKTPANNTKCTPTTYTQLDWARDSSQNKLARVSRLDIPA